MNYRELPEGYELYRIIDLSRDKKTALTVNGLALLIALGMTAAALPFVPLSRFINTAAPSVLELVRIFMLLPASAIYIITHELIHGYYMKKLGGVKPKYGFTGLYAYAGSRAYFDRRSYSIIALAPVVLWCTVLMVLNFALPVTWFWFFYIIQIINISGAAGDFYMSVYVSRLPAGVLMKDSGLNIEIYAPAARNR